MSALTLGERVPVPLPQASRPLPSSARSYPFSAMSRATQPFDLMSFGYVEEEYLLSGAAGTYEAEGVRSARPTGAQLPYCTRVLVRRPVSAPSGVAWLSILNASQGYDIEDDWRRAWDYIIANRQTYVALSAKPISADALVNFDRERYSALDWGGPLPGLIAEPGWDPFQVLPGSQEGLAWDVIAQCAGWLRSGVSFAAPRRIFLMGQSQSGIYTNTYLTFFHDLLRREDGGPLFDGYLPGVASVLCRPLVQDPDASGFSPVLVPPADVDVPVIAVTCEGDTALFTNETAHFLAGDGPLRRHWQVAGAPHSDARSRVIPANGEILRARRLPRVMDADFLARLNVLPLEPVITASMKAIVDWVELGVPAAPSVFFAAQADRLLETRGGNRRGGIRLGLLAEPLARFVGAASDNPVLGELSLLPRTEVLSRFSNLTEYLAACDAVDDVLESLGYLEPHGRTLLHRVADELWRRVVLGESPLPVTPQQP